MAIGIEAKGELFGLLVDAVGEVLKLADFDREPNPINLDGKLGRFVGRRLSARRALLVVLDIDRILDLRGEPMAA